MFPLKRLAEWLSAQFSATEVEQQAEVVPIELFRSRDPVEGLVVSLSDYRRHQPSSDG